MARHGFDALERCLSDIAPIAARRGVGRESRTAALFGAAGGLGWLRNRLSRAWPSPDQVDALFPSLDTRSAARLAWRIGALEGRNRLLVDLLRRRGFAAIRPLVHLPASWRALRPPLILCTFHIGAMQGLGAALELLPAPVLAFRMGILSQAAPPLEIVSTSGGAEARAAAFHRALERLRRGGFVAMAIDDLATAAFSVPCLGRTLALARGPFALARLTGAPLVPTLALWRSGRIEILIGEPWPAAAAANAEAALALAAGRWLDRHLRDAPADLGLGLLRRLLAPVA